MKTLSVVKYHICIHFLLGNITFSQLKILKFVFILSKCSTKNIERHIPKSQYIKRHENGKSLRKRREEQRVTSSREYGEDDVLVTWIMADHLHLTSSHCGVKSPCSVCVVLHKSVKFVKLLEVILLTNAGLINFKLIT